MPRAQRSACSAQDSVPSFRPEVRRGTPGLPREYPGTSRAGVKPGVPQAYPGGAGGNSIQQLKVAQSKFTESEEAVCGLGAPGDDILVPLTASMYVPGQLSKDQDLLVDIGTGYYVQMNRSKAADFFKRKIDFLTKNIEKVTPILQDKVRTKQIINEVLQAKVQAQIQAEGQAKS